MSFGRIWCRIINKRKINFNSEKNQSKVRSQGSNITVKKKRLFKLFPRYFKKVLTKFDELWQDGIG